MALVWTLAFFILGQLALPILIFLGLIICLGILEGRAGLQRGTELVSNPTVLLPVATVTVLASALGITIPLLRSRFRRALALRPCAPLHAVLVCLMAPPLYLLVLQIYGWVAPYVPNLELLEKLAEAVLKSPWWLVLIAGAVFPGISEELFCRGFLGRGLVARWGIVLGTLFASIFFGLLHIEPAQACYAAVIGIVLQFVYLTTKSLLAPMLLHLLNNSIAFLPSARKDWFPGVHELLDGWEKTGGLPWPVLVSALAAVAVLLLLLYETRVRWHLPDGRVWSPGYVTAEMPPARLRAAARSAWPRWQTLVLAFAVYDAYAGVLIWQFYSV